MSTKEKCSHNYMTPGGSIIRCGKNAGHGGRHQCDAWHWLSSQSLTTADRSDVQPK